MTTASGYCAIDFGTSNSAMAIAAGWARRMRLVELEPGQRTCRPPCSMPPRRPARAAELRFGRAAVAAYVDGIDGRLMRSMKSILGSD